MMASERPYVFGLKPMPDIKNMENISHGMNLKELYYLFKKLQKFFQTYCKNPETGKILDLFMFHSSMPLPLRGQIERLLKRKKSWTSKC